MQCRVLMHRYLPHHPYCYLLPSYLCMLYLVIGTYFSSSLNAPLLLLHVFILFLYLMVLLFFIGVVSNVLSCSY